MRMAVLGCAGSQVERLLQRLVALAEDLLANLREVADLAERTRYVSLPTRDEDARGDDSLKRLAAEQLLLVGPLIELLRDVGNGFWKGELVAPTRDVAEGLKQVPFRARTLGSVVRTLELLRQTRTTVLEGDAGVELLDTLHQGV